MRFITVIVTLAAGIGLLHNVQGTFTDTLIDKPVDKMVDTLLGGALKQSPFHVEDLIETTLGKPGTPHVRPSQHGRSISVTRPRPTLVRPVDCHGVQATSEIQRRAKFLERQAQNDKTYDSAILSRHHKLHKLSSLPDELVAVKDNHVVNPDAERMDKILRTLAREAPTAAPIQAAKDNANVGTGKSRAKKGRGLESYLTLEPSLKEFWYPVEFSSKLTAQSTRSFDLFDEKLLLFRGKDGRPAIVKDDGKGHGKTIDGISLPTSETDGLIWVYPGLKKPPDRVPYNDTKVPEGFDVHAELRLDVPVEHGLLVENLLDLAHAPFTHTSTFAKGWPVPDKVAFKTVETLAGYWNPYPIDMSFSAPCLTNSNIGLAQPGKIERGQRSANCRNHLHQLHVCLPAGNGRTTLLYRMSLDFLGWTRGIPFIQDLWKRIANQVLGEDLRLVLGQQENMRKYGPTVTWQNPMPYDKLAIRYRRWRNHLPDPQEGERSLANSR